MRQILKNRYRITEKLGAGTTGQVYKVWDLHMEKEWAVKELEEAVTGELQILKALSHHQLPRIVDAFREEGRNYLVMDYIKGITLEEMQKRGPIQEKTAVNLTKQIIRALLYFHENDPPLLYLDLKPSNIIVEEDGMIKLIDVGSVMVKGRGGRVSGTPGFASPEQIRVLNGGKNLREQSDIFSLGMLIFSMVTGNQQRLPIVTSRRRHGVFVCRYNPLISPMLERIVEKCTRPSPERRFLSLRDVYQQLDTLERRLQKGKRGGVLPLYRFFPSFHKPDWRQEKSILCTQGKPGLYIAGTGIMAFVLLSTLFPSFKSVAGEEELEVIIRDKMGRKVLVKEGCAYETGESLLFEIDWEALGSNNCEITILCEGAKGSIRSFQMDCVKK